MNEESGEVEESVEVEESSKSGIPVVTGKSRSAFKNMIGKNRAKTLELIVFSILQYIFLPVVCGFLVAGILTTGVLEKLGLNKFDFANFPTIKMHGSTLSTYSGLALAAGLGCVIGLILSRILKFGARLGHFDYINPPKSVDAIPIPSVTGFIKSIIRLVAIPVIVVLGAMTVLELAKLGVLPAVRIDKEYQIFEVTFGGMAIVAAVGCLLMFVYNMILQILLKMTRRKEAEIKELR